jgi:hypothetical protein
MPNTINERLNLEISKYLSIITLSVNGLNFPNKTQIVRLDQKARSNTLLSTRNNTSKPKAHIN